MNTQDNIPGYDTAAVQAWIKSHVAGLEPPLTWTRLEGGHSNLTYLLEDAGVGLVFGGAFGLSPHFRVSYAASDEILKSACEKIATAVSKLKN